MKCKRFEKWISDGFDLALAPEKQEMLKAHLARCPDCRAYRERLGRLQTEAGRLKTPEPADQYWEAFSRDLEKKLRASPPARKIPADFRPGWKWARAGVPVFVAALSLFLILKPRPAPENEVFFFEACLNRLSFEIGNDAGLADSFERILLGSMREGLYAAALEEHSLLARDSLFLDNLSDDELRFIEQEIKKEMKS
jgi:anti-sigma factor RsiW